MTDRLRFSAPTQAWFAQQFQAPTPVQQAGWPVIGGGRHALLVAPTGSGKTLAAFLWGLDRLYAAPRREAGVRLLYVSPLKALVYDIERNLRVPLAGIRACAQALGLTQQLPDIDVRTGDSSASERRRQARHPREILVTTPESLYLLLGSGARATLGSIEAVIVDEIHVLAATKRGAHLALSLERLAELCADDPQRIGLTATVRPALSAARFLGGDRDVEVVDAGVAPSLDLTVSLARADTPPAGGVDRDPPPGRFEPRPDSRAHGAWPALYRELLGRVQINRTTLIFVNSRALCERLAHQLNELAGTELVFAHHGSVSHERRSEIETRLKNGLIRGLVATSSLELGIDMGAIDEVLLVESPGAVARGLQRVGRAGHAYGAISRGRIYAKFRGDLLEATVVAARMVEGRIETLVVPENALDVLAQQIAAMVCDQPRERAAIARLVRRAWPYRRLGDAALDAVLDMLSGHYPSADFADLRPLLVWDRPADQLVARRGTRMLVRLNAGTIPDRGLFGVYLGGEGPRIGELDEEMVYETRVGDNLLLGASTWHVVQITRDRVVVAAAPGEPGRLPFWRGEGPGRPLQIGRALGRLVRELDACPGPRAEAWLRQHSQLDASARASLLDYLAEQKAATGCLPTDQAITVERFRDELGDWRVCLLSPFGARVHAPWALALQCLLGRRHGFDVQALYSDDGIVLRFADSDTGPDLASLLPEADELDELITEQLADSALFAGLFRENAARSLLLPRRRHDRRQPLWAQRLKAQQLLADVRRYRRFPIVIETYRQCLGEVFDLPALKQLLLDLRARRIRIDQVETERPSPFARSLVFAYVAAYLYEGDAPLAERRAQALTLDRGLLAELLGQAELRDLLDPTALADLLHELQCLGESRQARDADQLHDLLRRLGDLDADEVRARCQADPEPWLSTLQRQGRALRIDLAGSRRWIAAQDAVSYSTAFGGVVADPPAIATEAVDEAPALAALLRRYARCHGPFTSAEIEQRYALSRARTEAALTALLADGQLLRGEIRPAGSELEWCDPDILRRLRRLSLARLRAAVAPVDARVLGRFLPAWQGVGNPARGPHALLETITQLQDLALPWSSLVQQVLPARVPGFRAEDLDALAAAGSIVWIGAAALARNDGRIRLLPRASVAMLCPSATPPTGTPEQTLILEWLDRRGASFRLDLEQALHAGGLDCSRQDLDTSLWQLVWQGRISNDTFAPLRSLAAGPAHLRRGRRRAGDSLAGGRWFRIDSLTGATDIDPTRQRLARTRLLLQRYGVVSRELAQVENIDAGFAALYPVLRGMEDSGQVQRGYFVEGLSGAQFALPGAVDRLRGLDAAGAPSAPPRSLVLAAVDPANPYGSLLPWPAPAGPAQPRRVAGALVVMVDGAPVIYAGPGWRQLVSFAADAETRLCALRTLAGVARGAARRRLIAQIDGRPALDSTLRDALLEAGFKADYDGFTQPPAVP